MDIENLPPLNQLSIEQKDALIIELFALVQTLRKEVVELKQEVADLKNKLNQNSQNSHKPPSSDGFKKPQSQREKSNKKSGGQPGHAGRTLKICDKPDQVIQYDIDICPHCLTDIKNTNPLGKKIAQVFDLPELKIEVTEHRVVEKICPNCGICCSSDLPKGVRFGLQYGNKVKSFLVYLHHYHYIASERITEFFEDVFGHSISEGMVFKGEAEVFSGLKDFEEELKEELKRQTMLHADETSLRVEGKNHWLHVLSNAELTHYFVHQKRGRKAMDEMGVLPDFNGILSHDHWKPYFQYGCDHSLCNAHHLRELKAVFEGTCHEWANKMQTLLRDIKCAKEQGKLQSLLSSFEAKYSELINLGYQQANEVHQRGPPGKKSHPKEICLLDRLRNRKNQVLMFMYRENAPFDNNQAERDIRMMKVKMKISGCFRQKIYAQIFCRIRGYISTCKKKGLAILQALAQAFNGHPISCLVS